MMTKSAKQQLLEAAHEGDAESQYLLGLSFMEEDDTKQAKAWFLKAAEQGHPYAIMELASLFDLEENIEEARYWWLLATDHDEVSNDAYVCLHMVAEKEQGPIPFHEFIDHVSAEKAELTAHKRK